MNEFDMYLDRLADALFLCDCPICAMKRRMRLAAALDARYGKRWAN